MIISDHVEFNALRFLFFRLLDLVVVKIRV